MTVCVTNGKDPQSTVYYSHTDADGREWTGMDFRLFLLVSSTASFRPRFFHLRPCLPYVGRLEKDGQVLISYRRSSGAASPTVVVVVSPRLQLIKF